MSLRQLWRSSCAGAAYKVSFNGDGQELMHRDEVLPPSCMLGVRIAAGAIFGCDIVTMTKLPDHYLQRFTLAAVMGYLATQQRESLSLDADSLVLQLITVDELQLASRQAQLRHLDIDPGFPNSMVNVLGKWMTAGAPLMSCWLLSSCNHISGVLWLFCRFRQACWHLCSDGTGLKNAGIGLSRYKQLPRTINRLSNDQVTKLLVYELSSNTARSVQSLTTLFQHPIMATQLSLLAGLPGFLDMAARFLTPALRQSFPGSGEERK